MIVLRLLRKQRALLSSFYQSNCGRRPVGDAAWSGQTRDLRRAFHRKAATEFAA
jgi:hypothetical protein